MEGLLVGIIWALVYLLVICLVCYIIVRAAKQFLEGFAPYAWIVWAIGGLIWLVLVLRLFRPMLAF